MAWVDGQRRRSIIFDKRCRCVAPGLAIVQNGKRWAIRSARIARVGKRIGQEVHGRPAALSAALQDQFQGGRRYLACGERHMPKELRSRLGVVQGAVCIGQRDAKGAAKLAQAVAGLAGQQDRGQLEGVESGAVEVDAGGF
ncbi:MAG: hypothetical protein HC802_16625 [Caldilineaceae bacterium]|nr:hypothetical protein [Caldilineaceae bacterium]